MIFIDSNIPMYVIGAEHPLKHAASEALENLAENSFVTNVEVFQEIMHRYSALKRKDCIQPAWDMLRRLVDGVYSVDESDVLSARNLLLSTQGLSARDALHAAHLKRYAIKRILSFDKGFDQLRFVTRIGDPVPPPGTSAPTPASDA